MGKRLMPWVVAVDLITLLLTGLVAPFIGVLIDRLGVRALLIAGALMLSAAYFSYAHVGSLLQVYLIHLVFAAVLVACGMNVAVIMVSGRLGAASWATSVDSGVRCASAGNAQARASGSTAGRR